MTTDPTPSDFNQNAGLSQSELEPNQDFQRFAKRLKGNEERDDLTQTVLDRLQQTLQVDRVVVYYFYRQWQGQVTFESLSRPSLSIYGSTGADECFTDEYAQSYLQGRIFAIADITTSSIHQCHKDFLRSLQVYANLVVPILIDHQLWGLLIAHDCHRPREWKDFHIKTMRSASDILSSSLKKMNESFSPEL
ncbi:MAG: GAF domain-containing protein [Microcoleaceae cyanobacterium]